MSNLVEIVDKKISQVRTNNLDISFNELLDMYENDELIISPEYQRLFRWDEVKQSRFIETLMLELPLPPIFVIEIEEGKFELIDGLQRISSYLNFRGVLDNDSLQLSGCDIIPELNGYRYVDFPSTLKIKLKRKFIRVEVLRKESDNTLRYHMFKRLNSGGEILSDQEIRNSTIRLLNPKINNFIIEMSQNEDFKITTSRVTKKEIEKKFNEELVLRFFTLKNNLDNFSYPFREYLTNYMELVASTELNFNYDKEKDIFNKTFFILRNILDENIFSTKLSRGNYQENFVLYYYDGLVLGIQKYLIKIIELKDFDILKNTIENIKNDNRFYKARTGSKSNIKTRIKIVEEKLEEFFNEN